MFYVVVAGGAIDVVLFVCLLLLLLFSFKNQICVSGGQNEEAN